MPTRDPAPKGAPCWFDLASSDTGKSREFYGELFGWTAEAPNEEFGGYINFQRDGARVAGCMANDGSMGLDGWSVYLATDDIVKVVEAAPAAGGAVMMPPMSVGDLGQMAFLTDPGGSVIGAWQPGEHKGFTVVNEPGAPGWFELHTREWEKGLDFYRDVFGETVQDVSVEDFHYAMFMAGDDQLAGVVDSSAWDDDPTGWFVYITVASADDTAAKAVQLGGTVVQAPEDTPYGRLATLKDSTGATIKLLQP